MLASSECLKVGPKTAQAAGESCPDLAVVNFSYTVVTPISLAPLLQRCRSLEVLKVAGITNWVGFLRPSHFEDVSNYELDRRYFHKTSGRAWVRL